MSDKDYMSDKEYIANIPNLSNKKLIDGLEWCGHDNYYNVLYYPILKEIKKRLSKERKKGEWISHENYDECSKCHCLTSVGFNYCPHCGAEMKNEFMEARDTAMSGYQKALDEISKPMQVIIPGTWTHSECPRCGKSFIDYEDNDDGYITRARSMERCPYCGQKLDWTKDENNMY